VPEHAPSDDSQPRAASRAGASAACGVDQERRDYPRLVAGCEPGGQSIVVDPESATGVRRAALGLGSTRPACPGLGPVVPRSVVRYYVARYLQGTPQGCLRRVERPASRLDRSTRRRRTRGTTPRPDLPRRRGRKALPATAPARGWRRRRAPARLCWDRSQRRRRCPRSRRRPGRPASPLGGGWHG
jgi:hypothetical protein